MNHNALSAGNKFAPSTKSTGRTSKSTGRGKYNSRVVSCSDEGCFEEASVKCCDFHFCLVHFHCTDHALHPDRSHICNKKVYKRDYTSWLEVRYEIKEERFFVFPFRDIDCFLFVEIFITHTISSHGALVQVTSLKNHSDF